MVDVKCSKHPLCVYYERYILLSFAERERESSVCFHPCDWCAYVSCLFRRCLFDGNCDAHFWHGVVWPLHHQHSLRSPPERGSCPSQFVFVRNVSPPGKKKLSYISLFVSCLYIVSALVCTWSTVFSWKAVFSKTATSLTIRERELTIW